MPDGKVRIEIEVMARAIWARICLVDWEPEQWHELAGDGRVAACRPTKKPRPAWEMAEWGV